MKITRFEAKDEDRVFELFEKVFHKRMSIEFWKWRFHSNFGEPIRYLMWEDDQLVGHYVVHPLPFKILEDEEMILFSMSVMTHPDYRGKGIFQKLADRVYHEAQKRAYKLAIGFPNINSHTIHFEKLGWLRFGRMTEFEKRVLSASPITKAIEEYKIEELSEFNQSIDRLWHHVKSKYLLTCVRDHNFLNWRYTDHPVSCFLNDHDFIYHKFIVTLGRRIIAYFVLKQFGSEKCHIIDLFGELDSQVMESVISFALRYCLDNKIPKLSLWMDCKKNSLTNHPLISLGFAPKVSDTYLGIRPLYQNLSQSITDQENWTIRMGDSDVF